MTDLPPVQRIDPPETGAHPADMSFANRLTRTPYPHDPDRAAEAHALLPFDGALAGLIGGAGGSSPFLLSLMAKETDWIAAALDDPEAAFDAELDRIAGADDNGLAISLRQAKRRMALLIGLADLGGVWPLMEVTGRLTAFADTAVARALRASLTPMIRRKKLPGLTEDDLDTGAGMVVLAMGKMGAGELNYSSDIDLICLFDETRFDPDDFLEARPAYIRATRAMTALLNDITGDGYVFRTDLRLRPDPSVTPVCLGMEAAERYYESLGRTWERAAYIKARPAAGDLKAGDRFLTALRPFVWRRHLDFAAIRDAHDMRLAIREHKGTHGAITLPGHNMKLGRGGIREIEFFTQFHQIIAGGRDPSLRTRGTIQSLHGLSASKWIPTELADTLADHYVVLRDVEHRIQMVNDAQTHDLPVSEDGIDRIAALCGADPSAFRKDLIRRMEEVHDATEQFFARDDAKQDATQLDGTNFGEARTAFGTTGLAAELGANQGSDRAAAGTIQSQDGQTSTGATGVASSANAPRANLATLTNSHLGPGSANQEPANPVAPPLSLDPDMVDRWRSYPALRSPRAQEIFARIRPRLTMALARAALPDDALAAFDDFLAGLPAGVQVFSLFEANPHLIDLLTDIVGTSPDLARYLARNASVFDAVIGGAFFADWPGQEALYDNLGAHLALEEDYERQLDAARRWQKDWHFRIGVHHLRGLITAEEAARQYADLAGAAISRLWPEVQTEFARRHGPPPGRGAVVLGMGSLGARRLNARSDLDLIVIYDSAGVETSDGKRPLASRSYYARLTQALVTAVSAPTAEGRLYEVDMRLRPSGNQGPVATSLQAFRDYQENEAWTWEHMALTRARPVAGPVESANEVEAFRRDLLSRPRNRDDLRREVAEMRNRIAAAKPPKNPWETKVGRGRTQDIELLAQAGALAIGDPLGDLEAGLKAVARIGWISDADAADLCAAWRLMWTIGQTGKLLTDRAIQPDTLGAGGCSVLLRDTGAADIAALTAQVNKIVTKAGDLVDLALEPGT